MATHLEDGDSLEFDALLEVVDSPEHAGELLGPEPMWVNGMVTLSHTTSWSGAYAEPRAIPDRALAIRQGVGNFAGARIGFHWAAGHTCPQRGLMDFFNSRCSGTDNGNSGFTLNYIVNLTGDGLQPPAEDRHAGQGGHGLDGRFRRCRHERRSVRNRRRASRSLSTSHCRSSRCMNGT